MVGFWDRIKSFPSLAQAEWARYIARASENFALVMELVEGQDLSELIGGANAAPHGPLPLDEALKIGRQIADARREPRAASTCRPRATARTHPRLPDS